jgi:hypothetical protein
MQRGGRFHPRAAWGCTGGLMGGGDVRRAGCPGRVCLMVKPCARLERATQLLHWDMHTHALAACGTAGVRRGSFPLTRSAWHTRAHTSSFKADAPFVPLGCGHSSSHAMHAPRIFSEFPPVLLQRRSLSRVCHLTQAQKCST